MSQITITGQGVEVGDAARRLIERSLRETLEPYGSRVASAHVRLWKGVDVEGPMTCYIRVDLSPSGGLGRGATEPDLMSAVQNASERVARAVKDQLAYPTRTPTSWWSAGLRT